MSTLVDSSRFPAGHVIAGRYRIRRLLGKGGMGAVYEAEHITLERVVALKVLLPQFAVDSEVVARFMQEARAAAAIGAPGIVEVFDLGNDDGLVYLAMEKLEGEELFERIDRDHPLPAEMVARVGVDLADAIAAAHANGIIHRDLKPQNVFLAHRGREEVVKVLDFGIAKLAQDRRADAPVTRTGQVFGTPLYMAPEQLQGAKDLDGRADVYAMGAILYEALAGIPPFAAESYPELVVKITTETPPELRNLRPDLPEALASIVEHAMAKDRDERIPSAVALRDALEAFLAGRSETAWADTVPSGRHPSLPPPAARKRPARRRWAVGGAVVVLVAVGAGLGLAARDRTPPPAEAATGDEEASSEAPSPPATPEEPSPPPASAGDPDEAASGRPAAMAVLPEAQPAPSHAIEIATTPPAARVTVDGRSECTTPCSVTLGDEAVRLGIERRGYRSVEQRIEPPWPDRLSFELRRRRGRSGSSASEPDLPSLLPR